RREDAIQHRHLVRVDAAGTLAPELTRPLGRGLERREIAEARDAPDEAGRFDPDCLADRYEKRHRVEQLGAVGRRLDAERQAVILDAHAHAAYAWTRGRELTRREQTDRRLDREREADVAGRETARALETLDLRGEPFDLIRRLGLGDAQVVEPGVYRGVDV